MNEPTLMQPENETAAVCCGEIERYIRRNPGAALLVAVGAGLALGLVARSLQPEPDQRRRLARLFADLEGHLRDSARPAMRAANTLAHEGANSLQAGLHRGEVLVDRATRKIWKRLRKFLP